MAIQFQLRRDTATNWASNNPILAQGEMGLDLTNDQIRIGDGATAWSSLAVSVLSATAIAALITASQGAPVTVSTLPASPVVGVRYYLDTQDDTARAAPGIYTYRDSAWWASNSERYAWSVTGSTTLPDIMDSLLRLTMTANTTLVMPTVISGGSFLVQIANADAYTMTIPAGVVYPSGTAQDFAGDCELVFAEQGGSWRMSVSATEVA
jgi:hypothetical protein